MKVRLKLHWWVSLAGVAILGLAFAGCAGDDADAAGDGGIVVATASGGSPTQPSSNGATEGQTITVLMTDNKFAPSTLEVEAGKKVTFIAKNQGSAIHNMKFLSAKTEGKDFASDALVNPEKESKFTVTFTKKGTVKFQCDFHLPDMVGEILVK